METNKNQQITQNHMDAFGKHCHLLHMSGKLQCSSNILEAYTFVILLKKCYYSYIANISSLVNSAIKPIYMEWLVLTIVADFLKHLDLLEIKL